TVPGQADDFLQAIYNNDAAKVQKLLAADPKLALKRYPGGGTALHAAAAGGSTAMVRALLDAGADVNAEEENGRTPLHVAATNRRKEVAALLLARGAKVDAKNKSDHFTPLHSAALAGSTEVAGLLLANGADVLGGWNGKDFRPSITPLHFAVR